MKTQTGFEATTNASLGQVWSALTQRIAHWYALHQQREMLARMSDDTLKDIGMSRIDIQQEAERPFWKAAVKH